MIKLVLVVAVATVGWMFAEAASYTRPVQTTNGPVRGAEESSDGVQYMSFKGIPFAAPPIGKLRFQAPQPPEKWTNVRDALQYGNVCLGSFGVGRSRPTNNVSFWSRLWATITNLRNVIIMTWRQWHASEDCLTLNVYTKQLGEEGVQPKPVLVWIYGGAFATGDSTDTFYGPEYLMTQDFVLVTTNYRIGPLGFLSTNTTHAPGNWGLKDQAAALQWVHDNIAQFGGDPNKVTIYGESAGGASTHYHLFSPLSRGLFHQAIVASGCANCDWARQDQQDRYSRDLAKLLGASDDQAQDPAERVEFLRGVSAKTLTQRYWEVTTDDNNDNVGMKILPFVPVIEPEGSRAAFIKQDPVEMLRNGNFYHVPMMIGHTDLEGGGLHMGLAEIGNKPEDMKEADENPCKLLHRRLRKAVEARNDCDKVGKLLRDTYFGGQPMTSSLFNFTEMFSDLGFHGIYFAQKWHAEIMRAPLYNYFFSFDGRWNNLKRSTGLSIPGASHGDELPYIFKGKIANLPKLEDQSPEQRMRERLVTMIGNFVKEGNPTPKETDLLPVRWISTRPGHFIDTLQIDNELTMRDDVFEERIALWEKLYKEYGGPLYNDDWSRG